MEINFQHRQSAHCESGVTSNLFSHHGVNISEAMAFGIGSGLFFGYVPFIRLNHLPLTTYRSATGGIIKRSTRRLGIELKRHKFRNPVKAMDALDQMLAQGIPVGCQTGGYWLPYFPEAYRFHFNMHNLIVYGKNGHEYFVSDPIFSEPVSISRLDLMKARFAKGALAPKGKMYYLTKVPENIDFSTAIKKSIKEVCRTMLKSPLPIIGVRGIRFLAGQIESWPDRLGSQKAVLYLGQVIRMQEEIGTGGGGFRFIYAAFLQEAADILDNPHLLDISERLTQTGDRWRDFAVMGARNCKGRASEEESYSTMADIVRDCADLEKGVYRDLYELVH